MSGNLAPVTQIGRIGRLYRIIGTADQLDARAARGATGESGEIGRDGGLRADDTLGTNLRLQPPVRWAAAGPSGQQRSSHCWSAPCSPVLAHQPLDPLAGDVMAAAAQGGVHPRSTVGRTGAGVDPADLVEQLGVRTPAR
ncbi:hypothetical protein GCM10009610_07050 [Pseudonocardia xinjiangensis]